MIYSLALRLVIPFRSDSLFSSLRNLRKLPSGLRLFAVIPAGLPAASFFPFPISFKYPVPSGTPHRSECI